MINLSVNGALRLLIVSGASLFASTSGLLCFCTSNYCAEPVCESNWCLIGLKEKEGVVKACGTDSSASFVNCRTNVGSWSEICSCNDRSHCNSFKQFREQIYRSKNAARHAAKSNATRAQAAANKQLKVEIFKLNQLVLDDPQPTSDHSRNDAVAVKTDVLVLIVVVPLSLGAMSVLVVVMNYYCKMC